MQITITDSFTLNPGDLSWEWLEKYGKINIYERTPPEIDIYVDRCKDAEVIIISKSGMLLSNDLFEKLPRLKLIVVAATGYNIIDVAAAKAHGIIVTNVPGYGTNSVAQHTIALLLELSNRVGVNSQSVANGDWPKAIDWCYSSSPIIELANKTLGIIGYGSIGQKVAEIANALGMKTIYFSNSNRKDKISNFVEMEDLLVQSDFITLHCPANIVTTKMINSSFLNKMKTTAYLINTSRGQLINEADLAEALNTNKIAGAALDVLSTEPPLSSNPLLTSRNCIITPHNAWLSFEARQRIMAILNENIEGYVSCKMINVVS